MQVVVAQVLTMLLQVVLVVLVEAVEVLRLLPQVAQVAQVELLMVQTVLLDSEQLVVLVERTLEAVVAVALVDQLELGVLVVQEL
jgi:hypothetical protein